MSRMDSADRTRGVDPASIPALVFFPNVPRQHLQAPAAAQSPNGVLWVPIDDLRPEGIQVTCTAHDRGIHLSCARNQSRFREGDILCLNRGDPFSQPKLMVTLGEGHRPGRLPLRPGHLLGRDPEGLPRLDAGRGPFPAT